MPKLLVSDYDDTLYTSNTSIYFNILEIEKFRKNGNKFAIATGRNFESIKKMIQKFKIPYDYLICNDGSIIFDNKDNIISAHFLHSNEVNDVLHYLQNKKEFFYKIVLYDTINQTNNIDNILEIAGYIKLFKRVKNIVNEMNDYFSTVNTYKFENYLFTKKPKNKSTAIKEIIEMYSIDRENVYTVGNAQNDYEMIKDYNGYNMLISNPILYKNSKGTVSSVKQLVKKINN